MRRVLGRGRDGRGGGRDSGRLRGPSLRLRLCFIVIFDVTLNGGEVVETYKYGNVAWHASPSKANVPSFAHQTSISSLFCSLHLLVSVTSPNNSLNLENPSHLIQIRLLRINHFGKRIRTREDDVIQISTLQQIPHSM